MSYDSAKHTARVVALTQPKADVTSCTTPQELLAYFARVSNAANRDNHLTGARLIRRLIADEEWSPLDMVNINFEIATSRRISRQILRHWSMRFQEFSQRWAVLDNQLPYYTRARLRDATNRAATTPATDDEINLWYDEQRILWNYSFTRYRMALERGQHPESACVILPEGMAPSLLNVNATLRTWLHYSTLRRKPSTQEEHRTIADQVWACCCEEFPILERV